MSAQPVGPIPEVRVVVAVVDADRDVPALPAVRADGRRWSGAWLVVRRGGAPVAVVEAGFDGAEAIPAERLRRLVDAASSPGAPTRATVPDAQLPSASVVVPTNLARPQQLRASLVALDQLDYPDAEVIVVDNSRDSPPGVAAQVVEGLRRVRVVREPVPGISAARNAGVAAARGEVIAFTDDDVQVDPGWLRALGTRFALRPDEDAVTGLILPAELETAAQLWFERHYGGFGGTRVFQPLTYRGGAGGPASRAEVLVQDWEGREVRRFAVYGAGAVGAGANMAFRASALRRLGAFDVALGTGTPARGGEDLAAFISLLWNGGVIGYEPAAVVFHTHRADYPELRDQLRAYGLGFTATLTSLVAHDPRHLLGVAAQLPYAVVRARQRRGAGTPVPAARSFDEPAAPQELKRVERLGAFRGPDAYVRSRLRARRATSA
ncbi:glycosyltransferase [Modestobacter sp. VKM Ac-2986]|uniref:glycosyltransferase n=1 Tax=Modestobacter sp. VKM Ac-2986 TaxID=3004140 RepID=UPI0022ABB08B|nr:glycosyltransferase [Modestobacter sp. VKM Ac-2986]MCZ2829872.1 glycosyltransferase [Modestobacter sp. VKM Ac-2986]